MKTTQGNGCAETCNRDMLTGIATFGIGAGVGAGLMYLYDPNRGQARRNQLRDQTLSMAHKAAHEVEKQATDAGNRLKGVIAEVRERFADEPVPDAQLQGRVRAKLGHLTPEARRIEVAVEDGHVLLRGETRDPEFRDVADELRSVPGVVTLEDQTHYAKRRPSGWRTVKTMLGIGGGVLAGMRLLRH